MCWAEGNEVGGPGIDASDGQMALGHRDPEQRDDT